MNTDKMTPLDAIKQKCKQDCCCGDRESWTNCSNNECPLWHFRFGTNPFRKRTELSDERKQYLIDQLIAARRCKK